MANNLIPNDEIKKKSISKKKTIEKKNLSQLG